MSTWNLKLCKSFSALDAEFSAVPGSALIGLIMLTSSLKHDRAMIDLVA